MSIKYIFAFKIGGKTTEQTTANVNNDQELNQIISGLAKVAINAHEIKKDEEMEVEFSTKAPHSLQGFVVDPNHPNIFKINPLAVDRLLEEEAAGDPNVLLGGSPTAMPREIKNFNPLGAENVPKRPAPTPPPPPPQQTTDSENSAQEPEEQDISLNGSDGDDNSSNEQVDSKSGESDVDNSPPTGQIDSKSGKSSKTFILFKPFNAVYNFFKKIIDFFRKNEK